MNFYMSPKYKNSEKKEKKTDVNEFFDFRF